jgi:hypothetical protein
MHHTDRPSLCGRSVYTGGNRRPNRTWRLYHVPYPKGRAIFAAVTLEPLDPATVTFVLSMTEPRWSSKARVVGLVGSFHGGAWLSARDVGEAVGRNHNRCSQLLNELEDDRVLLRRLARGTRPAWCEVNPDVAGWRNVAWSHDPATIEARLALHEKRLRGAGTALERLVARPIGVTQADLVARLIGAGLAPADPSLCHPNAARVYGAATSASRAAMARATSDPLSRAYGRGTSGPIPPTIVPSGRREHLRVVDGDGGASGEPTTAETIVVDEAALTAVRRAVLRRTVADGGGRHFINGRPLVQLTALVVGHPLEVVLEAIERGPAGELVPGFIGWLADNVGRPPDEPVDAGTPVDQGAVLAGRSRVLEARIVALRRQAAECDAEGAPEVGDSYRVELAECENELAELLGELTAEAR